MNIKKKQKPSQSKAAEAQQGYLGNYVRNKSQIFTAASRSRTKEKEHIKKQAVSTNCNSIQAECIPAETKYQKRIIKNPKISNLTPIKGNKTPDKKSNYLDFSGNLSKIISNTSRILTKSPDIKSTRSPINPKFGYLKREKSCDIRPLGKTPNKNTHKLDSNCSILEPLYSKSIISRDKSFCNLKIMPKTELKCKSKSPAPNIKKLQAKPDVSSYRTEVVNHKLNKLDIDDQQLKQDLSKDSMLTDIRFSATDYKVNDKLIDSVKHSKNEESLGLTTQLNHMQRFYGLDEGIFDEVLNEIKLEKLAARKNCDDDESKSDNKIKPISGASVKSKLEKLKKLKTNHVNNISNDNIH